MLKKKVLIVTARADHGGGPEHIYKLLMHLENIELYVSCPKEPPYWRRYEKYVGEEKMFEIPHRKISIVKLMGLVRFVWTNKISVVHTHGKGAGIYGRVVSLLTGSKCIHTPHGVHIGEYGPIRSRLYRLYENMTSYVITKIIYVSSSEKSSAQSFGIWRNVDKTIINNGVETKAIINTVKKKVLKRDAKINSDKIVILTVTRFDYAKNMEEAYSIAKLCPRYQFIWVGGGGGKNELIARSKEDRLDNILFAGFVDRPEMYYKLADVYLNTSRWEGMPIAVLEAMAHRLPIVASQVDGNKDIVEDMVNGFLYKLGDIDNAMKKLKILCEDQNLRKEMGATNWGLVNTKYSAERMAHEVEKVYCEVEKWN
jgi:glycosyltransferase involved in cell wall biosynthesis